MNIGFLFLAGTVLFLGACGGGGEIGAEKGAISEERTAAFKSMMPEYMAMGKMVQGEEDFDAEKFEAAARVFAHNARRPFEYFQNDPEGNGAAKPVVWEKAAEFKKQQDGFLAAVDELNAKAKAGNIQEIKAAYGKVGESCKACHGGFKFN